MQKIAHDMIGLQAAMTKQAAPWVNGPGAAVAYNGTSRNVSPVQDPAAGLQPYKKPADFDAKWKMMSDPAGTLEANAESRAEDPIYDKKMRPTTLKSNPMQPVETLPADISGLYGTLGANPTPLSQSQPSTTAQPAPTVPAQPASAEQTAPAAPATPAKPQYDPSKITRQQMRQYARYTGARNMNSDMDRWKTWQAMQGNRNASNADYWTWKRQQQAQPVKTANFNSVLTGWLGTL